MSTHIITVLQAIEDEVQHNRREMMRITREHGGADAELSWEFKKQRILASTATFMQMGQPVTLGDWIELAGMLAYDLELLTENQVAYDG